MSGLFEFTTAFSKRKFAIHAEAVESISQEEAKDDTLVSVITTRTGTSFYARESYEELVRQLGYWLGGVGKNAAFSKEKK